jgi:arginyl-tRNA synthetase
MNHRTSDYVFDLEKFSTFEGKTGPYILYSAVRIKSILRKAQELNISEGAILPPQDHERSLMLLLCQLPDVLCNAAQAYAPHYLCDFVYTLAQEFNRFYKECHILREPDKAKQASWLALAKLCLRQLELVMNLLGIKIPEKM